MSPDERTLHQLQRRGADLELPRRLDQLVDGEDAVSD